MRGSESCFQEVIGRPRGWLTPMHRIAVSCVGLRESPIAGMGMVMAGQKRITVGFS